MDSVKEVSPQENADKSAVLTAEVDLHDDMTVQEFYDKIITQSDGIRDILINQDGDKHFDVSITHSLSCDAKLVIDQM